MTISINEAVSIHETALNLTDTESNLLYTIIYNMTYDFHKINAITNEITIIDDIFFQYYPSIMFQFMTTLIDLKLI